MALTATECNPRPISRPRFAARKRRHLSAHVFTYVLPQLLIRTGELSMSNTMRWRYGDTCPVMLPVDSATVIEIGDMLYIDTDDAKPESAKTDQGTKSSNHQ